MRASIAILIICLNLLLGMTAHAAQATAQSPDCAVEHRSPAAIVESTGSGEPTATIGDPIPYVPPSGELATPHQERQVEESVDQIVGCVNAGDFLGFLSLLSNDFLRRYGGSMDIEDIDSLSDPATPAAVDDWLSVTGIRDVTVVADGRIQALVLFEQGDNNDPSLTSVLTFVSNGDRLLIDDWQPVSLDAAATGWQVVSGPGFHGAIVPAPEIESYIQMLTGETIQGTWIPTPEQIQELEAQLPGFLATTTNVSSDLPIRLDGYWRHYAGFVADGRAFIMINAFCESGGSEWESQPVIVMDGGDCFFHVIYDPTTGTFIDLMVNGDA
jgi:hypothetical protein